MPRLPTLEDMGPRPTPSAPRGVVSVQADIAPNAAVRNYEQQAQIARQIGLDVDNLVEGMQRQGLAKSRSDFLAGKVALDAQYAQDQDFETLEERYSKDLAKLRDASGKGLFGEALGAYQNQTKVDIAQGLARTKATTFEKRRNHNLAELAGLLDTNRSALLSASDHNTRESLLNATKDSIRAMREQGFLSEVEAAKMSREFSIDYAASRVTMMAPQDQFRELGIPEGWSPGDKLPPRQKDGSPTDLIPEDMRVDMARKAMPGVNARVAIDEADRIEQEGGDIDSKLAKAAKIRNPTVRREVEDQLKRNFAFETARDEQELIGLSQEESDRILKSGLSDASMIEAVDLIEDPKLRDATAKRVKSAIDVRLSLEANERQKVKRSAWLTVTQDGTTDTLTPEQRSELDGTTLDAMERYARTKASGREPVHQSEAWTEFVGMSATELADMDAADYQTKYRNRLDDAHFDKGLDLLRREKSAEAKLLRQQESDENKRRSYADADNVASQIVAGRRLDKKDDAVTIDNLRVRMTAYVDQFVEENKGKYPTRTELLKYGAGLVLMGEAPESGWWGRRGFTDTQTRVDTMGTEAEAGFVLDTSTKALPGISAATGIPQRDLPAIIQILKDTGTPVTLENITRALEFSK